MSTCQHCGREHPQGTPKCPVTGDSMQSPGLIGTRVDRYEIERLLGAGGFGSVYRAQHVHTGAKVALKLLKKSLGADQAMLERFLREARAAAAVGSEHIVAVTDAGLSNDGQAFLALEFLDGMDLNELSQRERPLPPMRVVMVVLQVLEGLGAAHAKGIVHRDMKPANVFVVRRRDERGTERDFVKLLDFGISKMHAEGGGHGLTQTGMAMGTPSYMAPEQFFDARSVDGRADVYSVAAMLYELLAGQLPLDAESYAHLIVKVRTEQPVPLQQVAPQIPAALAQVVMVGLAKDAAHRWQNTREFAEQLRSAMSLPAQGSTPAFLPPAQAPAPVTPVKPAATPALEQTHTPTPQKPAPPSGGWVVPTNPSANTGQRISQIQQPGQQGALTPAAPSQPPAVAPMGAVAQAPAKSSALKWVLIIVGGLVVLGGCCTSWVVWEAMKSADNAPPTSPVVTPKTPANDTIDQPEDDNAPSDDATPPSDDANPPSDNTTPPPSDDAPLKH